MAKSKNQKQNKKSKKKNNNIQQKIKNKKIQKSKSTEEDLYELQKDFIQPVDNIEISENNCKDEEKNYESMDEETYINFFNDIKIKDEDEFGITECSQESNIELKIEKNISPKSQYSSHTKVNKIIPESYKTIENHKSKRELYNKIDNSDKKQIENSDEIKSSNSSDTTSHSYLLNNLFIERLKDSDNLTYAGKEIKKFREN